MSNIAYKSVREVIEKYKTTDPFDIAEKMNIQIEFAPLIGQKAVYVNISDTPIIVINDRFRCHPELRFIVSHELFHAFYHYDLSLFYHKGYNVRLKFEREANQFATYLCLVDATIHEGQTYHNLLMEYGIPLEMERYIRSV